MIKVMIICALDTLLDSKMTGLRMEDSINNKLKKKDPDPVLNPGLLQRSI